MIAVGVTFLVKDLNKLSGGGGDDTKNYIFEYELNVTDINESPFIIVNASKLGIDYGDGTNVVYQNINGQVPDHFYETR